MATNHVWKFFRTGGLDQVSLETGADLLNLENLDQKLWVALSCPVKGLELDENTLKMIDTDGDGRIRVPELLAAIKWTASRLKDAGELLKGEGVLALTAINDATPEGRMILASAKQILANVGKKGAAMISVADTSDSTKIFAASSLNGDGVIPPDATDDAGVQALIRDIVACTGGTKDLTGGFGVTAAQVASFYGDLAAYAAWSEGGPAALVLGDRTAAASAAIAAVRVKVDDFFARCRLAAFDARALAALNRSESEYLAVAAKDMKITSEEVSGFPLATIAAGKALPLAEGVNPAWAKALAALQNVAGKPSLTEAEWTALCGKIAAYDGWIASKAGAAVEPLGLPRIKELLAGSGKDALAALLAQDKALEPEFKAITEVNRLMHYCRDMRALLHNFVNFADFYSRDRLAVFQAGTLYLDARSTEMCVKVDGPSPLAAMSKAYIAYCACTRPGGKAMTIAACFMQGDSDYLFVGRHGIFYDRAGQDWDAVITSIVDNPISIRQAFWSPYKKFVRMIEEQAAKRAAAAEAAGDAKLATAATSTVHADKSAKPEPKKIDVGAVAALGVAVSGITAVVTAIIGGILGLAWWKIPLAMLAVMLVISGPAMIIAWLKLRQRTLGPILEGNGWAVNGRVKINIPFGTALTDLAQKPPGSRISLEDPYEDKEAVARRRRIIMLTLFLLVVAATGWIRWDALQHRDAENLPRYFWDRPAVPPAPPAPAPAAAATPPAQ